MKAIVIKILSTYTLAVILGFVPIYIKQEFVKNITHVKNLTYYVELLKSIMSIIMLLLNGYFLVKYWKRNRKNDGIKM